MSFARSWNRAIDRNQPKRSPQGSKASPILNSSQLRTLSCFHPSLTMRPALRLLASTNSSSIGNPLKPVPLALLPPIPLYRRILRAHRKYLPHEQRVLGDMYVKSEFRAHRNVDNPVHIVSSRPIGQLPLSDFTNRLVSLVNGKCTRSRLKEIHGEVRRWISARLIK